MRKAIKRRHPIKVMLIEVVGVLNPEHKFDGTIFIQHIAKQ